MLEIGKYRLESRLGTGGYGEVWRGWLEGEQGFRKPVAVKLIREATGDHAIQFVNEARIGARLKHPNIVDVYEFTRIDGQYVLAMELVEGVTLESILDASKNGVGKDQAMDLVRQVAAALRYAHDVRDEQGEPFGLVHRDLKPANIMLDRNGVVKVLDFGIALYRNADRTTGPGMAKGTLCYMAPEQLQGAPPSQAVDLWALGVIAYEAVTGQALVPPGDLLQAVLTIQDADGDELAARMRSRCPELADVVQHTLIEAPGKRWSAARILEHLGQSGPHPTWPVPAPRDSASQSTFRMEAVEAPATEPRKPPARSRTRGILVATIALAALGAGAVAWRAAGREPDGLVRGGELRMAWPRTRGTLAPYERAATLSSRLLQQVMEPLIRLDRDGRPLPGPVASWHEEADALTLELRPDVWFHAHACLAPEGRLADAEDLRASLEIGRAKGRFHADIADVRVVGERTVRIGLRQRSPFALRDLAEIPLLPADLARCEDLDDLRQPVGTGPFRFAGAADGDALELVAHGASWRRDALGRQLPYVDRIVARGVPSDQATTARDALRELAAGRLDVFDAENGIWLEDVLARDLPVPDGVDVLPEDARGTVALKGILALRERPRPLERELRRAIAQALDREALAAGPDADEFVPGDRLLPPVAMGYDPGLLVLPYDPVAAAARVAAAGGWIGEPLVLGAFESDQGLADGIAASLSRIGLPTRVVRFTLQSLEASLRDPQADLLILETYAEMWGNDPYPELADLVGSIGDVGFVPDDVRAAMTDATHEVDRSARERLYARIERGFLEDAGFVPLGTIRPGPTGGVAARAAVHGLADPTGERAGDRDLALAWIER